MPRLGRVSTLPSSLEDILFFGELAGGMRLKGDIAGRRNSKARHISLRARAEDGAWRGPAVTQTKSWKMVTLRTNGPQW